MSEESAYETRYVGQLVSDLADARAAMIDERNSNGHDVPLIEEQMFAKNWLRKAIIELQETRLKGGAQKLGEVSMAAIAQGVMDTAFSGARLLRTWAEYKTAPNMTAQGIEPVRLEHADGRIEMLPPIASTLEEFRSSVRACRAVSSRPDAPWDHLNHELELVLNDGTRLTAIDFVVETPFVTLRRPTLKIITLPDLVKNDTLSDRCAKFLDAAVKSELRIMVAGSMNSGKTVTLRALAASLPRETALVTVESSGELLLKDGKGDPYPDFITPMEARKAGADGHGAVTLNHLVENAQRMSPTCVIIGELRGAEAEGYGKALRQGYQVLSTIHGSSAINAVYNSARYLSEHTGTDSKSALEAMAMPIDLVVFMDRINGKRFVSQVAEIEGAHDGVVKSFPIYEGGVMNELSKVMKDRLHAHGFGNDF